MGDGGCGRSVRAQRLWRDAGDQDDHDHYDDGARVSHDDQRSSVPQAASGAPQVGRELNDAIVRRQYRRQEGDDDLRLR